MSILGQLPAVLGTVLAAVTLTTMAVAFWRARKKKKAEAAAALAAAVAVPPAEGQDEASAQQKAEERRVLEYRRARLPVLFAAEIKRLRKNSTGGDFRYRIPWCLAIGPAGSGQSTALRSTGMHSPFGSEDDTASREAGCHWHFFDKGVVVDVEGLSVFDEETFDVALRLLRRERPSRPLDSLLLCVPATDLVGEGRLDEEALRKKAEVLYARLQQMQSRLSIRVPVYVLITKCDEIPGFQPFCGALPPSHREQIFGWSSPYPPESIYQSAWVDEAFEALYRTQCLTQMELLAMDDISAQEREAAFLFPRNLRSLSEPLHIFLDQLFKSNVYAEATSLRGLYFCGDAGRPGVGTEDAEEPRQPSFLNHLFTRKIFAETGMAQPLQSSLMHSDKMVTVAKVVTGGLALAGLLTLGGAYRGLSKDADAVSGFLEQLRADIGGSDVGASDRQRYARQAQSLLSAMGNVTTNRLRRVRLPTSFFSDVDDDVRGLIRESFESVILSGLHYGLEYKAKQTLGIDTDEVPAVKPAGLPQGGGGGGAEEGKRVEEAKVLAFASTPEYQELRLLGVAYAEFVRFVDLYNALSTDKHKRIETVGPLVKYVFQTELGEGFTKNSRFYEEALGNARYVAFDMQKVIPRVRERAKLLARQLHRRLFLENPVDLELDEIQRHSVRLKGESEWGGTDLASLKALHAVIVRLEKDIDRTELAWLAKESFDLGEPYRDLLATMRPYTPPGQTPLNDEIQNEWSDSFRSLKRKMLAYQAGAMGPIVLKEGDKGRLLVAPPVITLRNLLDGFLSQNYVQGAAEKVALSGSEGASAVRVSWAEDLLRQAVALSDSYTVFSRERLGQFHDSMRELVKNTARERLSVSMPSLIAKSRRTERLAKNIDAKQLLEELAVEVADLRRVAPLLRQILETYDRLEIKGPRDELFQQLEQDAKETLRRLDSLLEKDEMYKVSSKLDGWRGLRPPAYDAFDVDDAESLSQYLKAQRTRMKYWARDFAKTPVSLLEGIAPGRSGGGEGTDPLVSKWKHIVQELDYFEKMTPDNSVKKLESFIEGTLVTLTPDNCLDKLTRGTLESTDYFLQALSRINDRVRRRCVSFSEERLLTGFERLGARFNKDLSGKFPFSRAASGGDDEEADPRDVRNFLQEFDEYNSKFTTYADRREVSLSPVFISSRTDIQGFLESVRAVRPFFVPLLSDKGADGVPRYSLNVEFRINRANEINGSQVAEYSLAISDQRVEEGQAAWQLGDRIRVGFRFAKDGPYRPAENNQPKGASADKSDTLSFEWGGRWALLRFLRNYKTGANDLRRSLDKVPHILKFVMEIEERKRDNRLRLLSENYYQGKGVTTPQARQAFIYNKAIVYVRFAVALPDSKDPLVVPSEWPSTAPPLRGAEYR